MEGSAGQQGAKNFIINRLNLDAIVTRGSLLVKEFHHYSGEKMFIAVNYSLYLTKN